MLRPWVAVSALVLLLSGLIGGAFLTRYEYLPHSDFTSRLDHWTGARQHWHCGYYEKDANGQINFDRRVNAKGRPLDASGNPIPLPPPSNNPFDQPGPAMTYEKFKIAAHAIAPDIDARDMVTAYSIYTQDGLVAAFMYVTPRVHVCGWFTE